VIDVLIGAAYFFAGGIAGGLLVIGVYEDWF